MLNSLVVRLRQRVVLIFLIVRFPIERLGSRELSRQSPGLKRGALELRNSRRYSQRMISCSRSSSGFGSLGLQRRKHRAVGRFWIEQGGADKGEPFSDEEILLGAEPENSCAIFRK